MPPTPSVIRRKLSENNIFKNISKWYNHGKEQNESRKDGLSSSSSSSTSVSEEDLYHKKNRLPANPSSNYHYTSIKTTTNNTSKAIKNNLKPSNQKSTKKFTFTEACYCPEEVMSANPSRMISGNTKSGSLVSKPVYRNTKNAFKDLTPSTSPTSIYKSSTITTTTTTTTTAHNNEVTKEDLEVILNKLKSEAKDFIVVRGSLLELLNKLITDLPSRTYIEELKIDIENIKEMNNKLNVTISGKDKCINNLEMEISSKNNTINDLHKEIQTWKENIEKLKKQVQMLTEYTKELEGKAVVQRSDIEDKNKIINKYKSLVEDHKIRINNLNVNHQDEIDKLKYSLSECKQILIGRDQTIEKLNNDLNVQINKNKTLQANYNRELELKNDMIHKNKELQKTLEDYKNSCKVLDKFKRENEKYKDQVSTLSLECQNYEKQLRECHIKIQEKDEQISSHKQRFERMNSKIREIENKLKIKNFEVEKLITNVHETEKKIKVNDRRWDEVIRLTNKLYTVVNDDNE